MADKRITDLQESTAPNPGSFVPIAEGQLTKKVTINNLVAQSDFSLKKISSLPEQTLINNNDQIPLMTQAGVLQKISGSLLTSPRNVVDVTTATAAFRVTQRGTGEVVRFEDENNVDGSPFVINSIGNVGVGTASPGQKLTVVGSISATTTIAASNIICREGTVIGNMSLSGIVIGSQTNKATITYTTNTARTYNIPDVASSDFVMTQGDQTIAGTKTFSNQIYILGKNEQFPTQLSLAPATHSTSRRCGITMDSWVLGQDSGGNGTKDFFIYNGSTTRIPISLQDDNVYLCSSAGNVGIGTNSPDVPLVVAGNFPNGNGPFLRLRNTANVATPTYGPSIFFDTGRVGDPQIIIGSSQDTSRFYIGSPTGDYNEYFYCDTATKRAGFPHGTQGYINHNNILDIGFPNPDNWETDGGEGKGIRLSSGGNFDISTIRSHNYRRTDLTVNFGFPAQFMGFHRRSGKLIGNISSPDGDSINYNSESDYRLKENETPIPEPIEKVKNLKPYIFNWKGSRNVNQGFFAHEVQNIVPNAVTGKYNGVDESGKIVTQSMDYGKLTPLLTAALQKAIERIEELEAKVAALEA